MGQQGTLTRTWAERGTRPRAPRDTRYTWAYIFGAVCPARATTAALVMPRADTSAMNAHLVEIAKAVAPGAHAVLVMDGAGWHGSSALRIPDNITIVMLPPYAPELNPVENIWAYLRANRLAITVFDTYDDIVGLLAQLAAVLARHPHRVPPLFDQSGVVDDQHGIWATNQPVGGPRRIVEVQNHPAEVRIFEDGQLIASHPVLEGKNQRRVDPSHRKPVPAARRMAPAPSSPVDAPVARRPLAFYEAVGRRLANAQEGRP